MGHNDEKWAKCHPLIKSVMNKVLSVLINMVLKDVL